MEEKLTRQLNIAIGAVFIIAAGVLIWTAAARQAKSDGTDDARQDSPAAAAAETDATDVLKGMKEVVLAEGFESWTPEARVDVAKVRNVKLDVKGAVAKAFLLVRASESGNPLTKWDSIYFKFNNTGGHLFRPESLAAPAGAGTAVLFDLRDVPYLPSVPYSEERVPERANLLEMLAPGKYVEAFAFISGLRPSQIDELKLYYACEAGQECSIATK